MLARRISLPLLLLGCAGAQSDAMPFAYVTNVSTGTVTVIDTATETVVTTIPVGHPLYGVGVSPDGETVWVADIVAGLRAIDARTTTIRTTIPAPLLAGLGTGARPVAPEIPIHEFAVAVHPDGATVWVSDWSTNGVHVVDTTTATITASVPVGKQPIGLAFDPSGARLYVCNSADATVSVIDTATRSVLATVPVPGVPLASVVHPSGSPVYVVAPRVGPRAKARLPAREGGRPSNSWRANRTLQPSRPWRGTVAARVAEGQPEILCARTHTSMQRGERLAPCARARLPDRRAAAPVDRPTCRSIVQRRPC